MVVPDDIYKRDVDFTALAMQFAGFAKKLKTNGQLDFSDPESVRQLTKALLQRDFDLQLDLPEDRLCPPVPNRFNYILFLQKLVDSTRFDYRGQTSSQERVLGLDIGTGASAIYPLLACRQRSNWFFLATEIDTRSREYAVRNVKTNGLQSRIKVVPPDSHHEGINEEVNATRILPSSQYANFDDYAIKFQMTNPPFYASEQEMMDSAKIKSKPPNSACTGAPVEMITSGGEVEFMTRIIDESMLPENRTKIQWFSGMLGKLSSVGSIVTHLRDPKVNCSNYLVTEFVQGQKTRRWCVAWSWTAMRPPAFLARDVGTGPLKRSLTFPSEFEFDIQLGQILPQSEAQSTKYQNLTAMTTKLADLINHEVSKLGDMQWNLHHDSRSELSSAHTTKQPTKKTKKKKKAPGDEGKHKRSAQIKMEKETEIEKVLGIGVTRMGDSWSRKARRKQQQQQQQEPQKRPKDAKKAKKLDEDGDEEMQDDTDRRREKDEDEDEGEDEGEDEDEDDDDDRSDEEEEEGEEGEEAKYDDKIALAFQISLVYPDPYSISSSISISSSSSDLNPSTKRNHNNDNTTCTTGDAEKSHSEGLGIRTRIRIRIRWLQGNDSIMFESFCGWLKRRIHGSREVGR